MYELVFIRNVLSCASAVHEQRGPCIGKNKDHVLKIEERCMVCARGVLFLLTFFGQAKKVRVNTRPFS
ncbi:MAG: hypothetical protein IPO39_12825 [Bacteroidetes bacterium]|jgi:hypothetical protein|nr:hypothetical protein [Bacteroidota bacterium]MBK9525586.1 hypothetical protein [Bacteroidota bacterium]MBK9540845.1 hypothetical protein [Bacteroidota bacterium]MBP6402766.1 hypothetical protein [Bacteroidia bacterium]MBP6648644.1 hypothetical protein [Bacteroidia bacterium]